VSGSLRNVTQPIPELYNIQGVLFFVVAVWVRFLLFVIRSSLMAI